MKLCKGDLCIGIPTIAAMILGAGLYAASGHQEKELAFVNSVASSQAIAATVDYVESAKEDLIKAKGLPDGSLSEIKSSLDQAVNDFYLAQKAIPNNPYLNSTKITEVRDMTERLNRRLPHQTSNGTLDDERNYISNLALLTENELAALKQKMPGMIKENDVQHQKATFQYGILGTIFLFAGGLCCIPYAWVKINEEERKRPA